MEESVKNDLPVDYTSEFEYAESTWSETENTEKNTTNKYGKEVYKKPKTVKSSLVTEMKKDQYEKDYLKYQSVSYRGHLISMDAFSRHKKIVHDYLAFHGSKTNEKKNEASESVKDHNRFLWHEGDEFDSWGSRLAKKYWDRLFKEYVLIDLSRYEHNKFGMRWRLEKEVIAGKGQFICGSDSCEETDVLRSWEVKFNYAEKGEKRCALVKVRLCPECSNKLNYNHQRKEVTKSFRKRRLLSPVALDDEVMDRDLICNSNLDDIRTTVKRARRESGRSLTEDEDDAYFNGTDTVNNSSSGNIPREGNQDNVCQSSGDIKSIVCDQQEYSSSNICNQSDYGQVISTSNNGDNNIPPTTLNLDSNYTQSLVSSGASSPRSVSSEDEAVVATSKSSIKKTVVREEEIEKYIEDLLL